MKQLILRFFDTLLSIFASSCDLRHHIEVNLERQPYVARVVAFRDPSVAPRDLRRERRAAHAAEARWWRGGRSAFMLRRRLPDTWGRLPEGVFERVVRLL